MLKFKILIFLTFVLYSCSKPNYQNLGDNFWYINKEEAIDIGLAQGAIIYKSVNGDKMIIDKVVLSENIVDFNFNSLYIIAKRTNPLNSKIEFIIFNKNDNGIYLTNNYTDFKNKIEKLKIFLKLE